MNTSVPKINKILNTIKIHNEELIDNYSWVKQKDWKEVILDPNKLDTQVKKYLEEENLFKKTQLQDIKDIEKKLFKELGFLNPNTIFVLNYCSANEKAHFTRTITCSYINCYSIHN